LNPPFCLAAVVKGKDDFVNRMLQNEYLQRRSMANWLINAPDRTGLNSEHVEKLKTYVADIDAEWEQLKKLDIEEMARQGDIYGMYIFYREFSGDAAHPTVSSLSRYIEDNDGNDAGSSFIRWGPDCKPGDIAETVNLVCNFLLASCATINDFLQDDEVGNELTAHFTGYKELNNALIAARRQPQSPIKVATSNDSAPTTYRATAALPRARG
jgi:uncharacterized protein DUF5677